MAWDKSRRSPRNLTLPSDWPQRRRRVLERDMHQCRIRSAGCIGTGTICDHIVPVEQGGSHDDHNLQAACQPCHQVKSNAEASAARWRIREKRTAERHPGLI